MRTAETILREAIGNVRYDLSGDVTTSQLIYAVNQARKEALEKAILIAAKDGGLISVSELLNLIQDLK